MSPASQFPHQWGHDRRTGHVYATGSFTNVPRPYMTGTPVMSMPLVFHHSVLRPYMTGLPVMFTLHAEVCS